MKKRLFEALWLTGGVLLVVGVYLFKDSLTNKDSDIQPTPIPKNPQRIVSIANPVTEILYDLGAFDRVVGVEDGLNYPPAAKDKPHIGRGFGRISVEKIIGLKPDLVFCWKGYGNIFQQRGIPVYVVTTKDLDGVIELVLDVGRVVGENRKAKRIVEDMSRRIQRVRETVKGAKSRPLVYFEGGGIGRTRGPGSLTNSLIELAGGINIARAEPVPFPILSNEFIIRSNPDVIVVEEYGESIEAVKSRDGWKNIKAVRNNRIYKAPVYYTNYTPRCIEGLEQFARWFHPELFQKD